MGVLIALALFILACFFILSPGGSPKRRLIIILSQCLDQAVMACGALNGKYKEMEVKCDPEYSPGGTGADLCRFVFIKMEIPPDTDIGDDPGRFDPNNPGIFRDGCFLVYPFSKQKLLIRETVLIALEELCARINGNEPGTEAIERIPGEYPEVIAISCQNCGHEITSAEDHCPSCGWTWNSPASAKSGDEEQGEFPICVKCGKMLSPGEFVCVQCGQARKNNPLQM